MMGISEVSFKAVAAHNGCACEQLQDVVILTILTSAECFTSINA
jgi:hypothetical protein